MTKPRILLVDDEPFVVEGLALRLRRQAITESATSGAEALDLMRGSEPFDIVISDMRMPGMDGAAFLAAAAALAPDTIRILLTGQADIESAIAAINDGRIFRFLTKPCPPAQLNGALEAALEQRRLVDAERVLLRQTLSGSIRALTQVLAFARPAAVGRSERVKRRLVELGASMGEVTWQAETAAMFSQMGSLLLPPEVADRYYSGHSLSEQDEALIERMPLTAAELLSGIPRLEDVRVLLRACAAPGDSEPWGAGALRAVLELDALEERGVSAAESIAVLRSPPGRHDAGIVAHLERLVVDRPVATVGGAGAAGAVRAAGPAAAVATPGARAGRRDPGLSHTVLVRDLRTGMILATDVVDPTGRTLLSRGVEITPGLERRIVDIVDHADLGGLVQVYFASTGGAGTTRS